MNANEILTAAVTTLDQRGKDYDQPGGERSMGRIVAAFNALTEHEMTEAEGWQFMACLKLVRMGTASDPTDSAVDCAAYAALAGEVLTRDKERFARNKVALEQARAAAIEPGADGWIPWAGGNCPVPNETQVEIRLHNGTIVKDIAAGLRWTRWGVSGDIAAYRVVQETPAAEKKDEPWKPGDGEMYFFIARDEAAYYVDRTLFYGNCSDDRSRVAFGNCFRTREEAEAKRAEIIGGSA